MPSHDSEALDSKKQRLNKIMDKVTLHLHERRTRQILAIDSQKATNEIHLFEHKISKVSRRFRGTDQLLKDFETRTIESKRNLAELLEERTTAETELARLIKIEREMEAKIAIFSKLKSDVHDARADVHEATNALDALENSYLEAVAKKETKNTESDELKDKINKLLIEIPVIKNTRDMIAGIMPEGFDTEVIELLNNDVEASIESYTNEIESEIEDVKRQTSDLKRQIKNEKELESSLLSLETELQNKIENIKADVGDQVDKQTIITQTNQLRDRKEKLDKEFARNSQEMNQLEAESKALTEMLDLQKNIKNNLNQKFTELSTIKRKMDAAGDLDTEIRRIKFETSRNILETSVNNNLFGTLTDIKKDIESINEKMRSSVKNHDRQLENFTHLMDSLIA